MLATLIYPHQLFPNHPGLATANTCVLVEDPLLFRQYRFHAQKLILHRASMQAAAQRCRDAGHDVVYVDSGDLPTTGAITDQLQGRGITRVQFVDPHDDWLRTRLTAALNAAGIAWVELPDPHFLTPPDEFAAFASGHRKLFFTEFYIRQRQRLGILLDARGRPQGGKWSFDPENRKKLPRDLALPRVTWPAESPVVRAARNHVQAAFPATLGEAEPFCYPTTPDEARQMLREFCEVRLPLFGQYEDAIHTREPFLFHSVLTPALNIGLISPGEVVSAALERADRVPLNSLEGFVRQVIGWREYILGVYRLHGRRQRMGNFWQHEQPLPASCYDGTTGIEPVDTVIRRVLRHAYCHHIERLMILGNFLLLCEISPAAIYQWFMELFIDAYDWVMVPNVYGMSLYADGGLITTKPYISGSSYILRMSNFRRGPWCDVWDALYWRFIHKHRDFMAANPRMALMARQCDRLGTRLEAHLATAERFLNEFHRR